MGGCLVCWHEVMGLCVETATLLVTAAGTERRGEEGGPGCRSSSGVVASISSEGTGPVPGNMVTQVCGPLPAPSCQWHLLSYENYRPGVSWQRF